MLSLGLPPIEGMVGPDQAPDFARIANDGLAELCAKYPDRFCGYVGGLPMSVPDEAAKEAERILIHGNANGLQLHTNVDGLCLDEPRFLRSSRSRRRPASRSCCIRRAPRRFRTSPRKNARATRSGPFSAGPTKPAPPWRG